jgi:hypothetical protein
MSAWDDVQTEDVKQIEATVFRQMEGRSNSDPCSPWADLALALCQRIAASEARAKELERRLEGEMGMRDFENCCCASDAPPHDKCCNDDETRECRRCLSKRADAAEARRALREVEWKGEAAVAPDGGDIPACPSCCGLKPNHESDCIVARALSGEGR